MKDEKPERWALSETLATLARETAVPPPDPSRVAALMDAFDSTSSEIRAHRNSEIREIRGEGNSEIREIRGEGSSEIRVIRGHRSSEIREIRGHRSSEIREIRGHRNSETREIRGHRNSEIREIRGHRSSEIREIRGHRSSEIRVIRGQGEGEIRGLRSAAWLGALAAAAVLLIAIGLRPVGPARPGPPEGGSVARGAVDNSRGGGPQPDGSSTVLGAGDFIPWPGASALPPLESGHLVRMQLPVTILPSLGVVPPASHVAAVTADVVVGQDGLARAVRLVTD